MATFNFRLTVLSYSMQTCFILILLTLICHLVTCCDKKHYFLFYHIIIIDFFCLTSKSKVRLIAISSLEKKRKAIFLMATSHSRPTFLTWLLYVNIFHFATFGFNPPFNNLLQQKQFILYRIITIQFFCLTLNESFLITVSSSSKKKSIIFVVNF